MSNDVGSGYGLSRLYKLQPPPGHTEFRLLSCLTEKCAGDRFVATYADLAKHRLTSLDVMDAVRILYMIHGEPIRIFGDQIIWGPFQ